MMPDPEVRTIEVRFVVKSLFQLQTGIAQLALALLKKARKEGLEEFEIPPAAWKRGTSMTGWVDLDCDRYANIDANCEVPPTVDATCDVPPIVDETCEVPPPVDETCADPPPIDETCGHSPPIDETCSDPPPIDETCGGPANILDDRCSGGSGTENECDDATEMFCNKIESICRFLRLLCMILRYKKPF